MTTPTIVPPISRVPDSTEAGIPRAVYTAAEVAHLLSLSPGSTYALVRSGQIPARKIGARWIIPKQRFHAWLNAFDDAMTLNHIANASH